MNSHCCCRVIGRPFCVATSVCINLSQNELFSGRAFEAAEHLCVEKPSCVSLRCRKLIRFKKVMVEVLRFVSALFFSFSFFFLYHLKKKKGQHQNSTWALFSHPESWFKRGKNVSFHFICITLPCLRQGSHRVISKLACCHLQCLFCHSEKQASVQTHEPISHLLQKC